MSFTVFLRTELFVGRYLRVIRKVSRIFVKEGLQNANLFHVFEYKLSKSPVLSGNHGDDWTIWEMKMTAHLMEKGPMVRAGTKNSHPVDFLR